VLCRLVTCIRLLRLLLSWIRLWEGICRYSSIFQNSITSTSVFSYWGWMRRRFKKYQFLLIILIRLLKWSVSSSYLPPMMSILRNTLVLSKWMLIMMIIGQSISRMVGIRTRRIRNRIASNKRRNRRIMNKSRMMSRLIINRGRMGIWIFTLKI